MPSKIPQEYMQEVRVSRLPTSTSVDFIDELRQVLLPSFRVVPIGHSEVHLDHNMLVKTLHSKSEWFKFNLRVADRKVWINAVGDDPTLLNPGDVPSYVARVVRGPHSRGLFGFQSCTFSMSAAGGRWYSRADTTAHAVERLASWWGLSFPRTATKTIDTLVPVLGMPRYTVPLIPGWYLMRPWGYGIQAFYMVHVTPYGGIQGLPGGVEIMLPDRQTKVPCLWSTQIPDFDMNRETCLETVHHYVQRRASNTSIAVFGFNKRGRAAGVSSAVVSECGTKLLTILDGKVIRSEPLAKGIVKLDFGGGMAAMAVGHAHPRRHLLETTIHRLRSDVLDFYDAPESIDLWCEDCRVDGEFVPCQEHSRRYNAEQSLFARMDAVLGADSALTVGANLGADIFYPYLNL